VSVNIYRVTAVGQHNEHIAYLCDDEWSLPPQIQALVDWLAKSAAALPRGHYVADVGFQWRRNAGGGGSAIDPAAMTRMAEIGMYLFLSEYSGFAGEDDDGPGE